MIILLIIKYDFITYFNNAIYLSSLVYLINFSRLFTVLLLFFNRKYNECYGQLWTKSMCSLYAAY